MRPSFTATAASPIPLAGKRVMFIVFEFPTRGTAGYHTYNRSILQALLRLGATVDVQVLTPRCKRITDALDDLEPLHHLTVTGSGHLRIGHRVIAMHPLSWARWARDRLRHMRSATGPAARHRIVPIGKMMTSGQAHRLTQRLQRQRPDLVLLDTMFMCHAALRSPAPVVIVAHDVFHERTASLRSAGLEPHPAIEPNEERSRLRQSAGVIAISRHDAASLTVLCPNLPVHRFQPPMGAGPAPITHARPGNRLFYMGSAAHHNVQAMEWFFAEVWLTVVATRPAAELWVAGDIGRSLKHNGYPRVRWLGRVDDPVRYASDCTFAIDPVQAGSGVKIKITSYLEMGLHCLTTSAGAQGLEDYQDKLRVADGAPTFISSILEWLDSREGPTRTGESSAPSPSAQESELAAFLLARLNP